MSGTIQIAHGGGGRLSAELIEAEILPRFGKGPLQGLPDAANLPVPSSSRILFSTDSFVVSPWSFPGGNIGHLAVHGTLNDLSVSGGRPLWLSLSLILEEGLPLDTLRQVLDSVKEAAESCGVKVVTGDTKVVGRGQCDSLYINSSGIAEALPGFELSPAKIRPGDLIIASGPLGSHGMAILAAREPKSIKKGPLSDTGSVHRLVAAAQPWAASVRFMRDPTRGGAAASLNEAVATAPCQLVLEEAKIPYEPAAKALAEMLGLELLSSPSEGRLLMICAADAAEKILEAWRGLPEAAGAAIIGHAEEGVRRVLLATVAGGRRIVDMPSGELLPRIC